MILRLPYPPTVNTYWRHITRGALAGRVLISARGRAFRSEVNKAALAWDNRPFRLIGPLSVEITVFPPDRRKRDLDNLPKAILDALQHAGVYADDSQIHRLLIELGAVQPPGCVVVAIEAYG